MSSSGNYDANGYNAPVPDYGGAMAQQTGNAYSNPTTGMTNTNGADSSQQAMHDENKQQIAPEEQEHKHVY